MATTRKKISNLTLELLLSAAATGAALAEIGEGLWEQNPAKVIIGAIIGGLGGWIVRRSENEIISSR